MKSLIIYILLINGFLFSQSTTPFLINSFTTGDQESHSFTLLNNDNIFSTWQSYGQNGSLNKNDIYACIYNINGVKIVNDFLVSDSLLADDIDPNITRLTNNNVLITWTRGGAGPIMAKIYNSEGIIIKNEYKIVDDDFDTRHFSQCLGLNDGNYIIAYHYWGTYDTIKISFYNSQNQFLNSFKFQTRVGRRFRLAELNSGSSVIVYENYDQNGIGTFFRIFDLLGLGEEKQANLNYLDDQISPDVISLTNGNFVISWIDDHFDSTFTHLSIFNRYGVQISNEIKAIYEVGSFNTARLVQHKDDRFLMIYSNADTWNGTKLYGKEIFFDGQISFEDTQLFFTNKSFYGYEINKYNNDYLFFAFESSDLSGFGIYGVSISSYITAVDEKSSKHSFVLAQNFPNPFNPKTFIYYSLSKGSHIHIEVFDILGKKIKDLVNDFKNEGSYSEVFDGSDLSTGCYFYKFSTENLFQVKKMLLIK